MGGFCTQSVTELPDPKNVLTGTRLNAAGKPISPGGKFVPQAARGVKATTKGVLRAIPGVGGWGTSSCGGDCTCGDAGRMGMVCVSYI